MLTGGGEGLIFVEFKPYSSHLILVDCSKSSKQRNPSKIIFGGQFGEKGQFLLPLGAEKAQMGGGGGSGVLNQFLIT